MIEISRFNSVLDESYNENSPSKICTYLYELANVFNSYYQKVKILQSDEKTLNSKITMLKLLKRIFETGIDLLGFEAPDRM